MISPKAILFWQPKKDLQKKLLSLPYGLPTLITLNYLIWPFFILISFALVYQSANTFWQLFLATLVAEIIERVVKSKIIWPRPMSLRHDPLPPGLVPAWYQTGSFPSGHTVKAVYFFLFSLQYQIIHPLLFLFYTLPLLIFRVIIGFHYPIDLLGGAAIGIGVWLLAATVVFPAPMVDLVEGIFYSFFTLFHL